MVKTRELNEHERIEINRLNNQGQSEREVTRAIGCSQNTVKATLQAA